MISFSSIELIYFWLPLIGLIIGLVGTAVGGGGGLFFMPVLILLFGVPSHTAVTTSLVATIPIGLVGTIGHQKKGNVDLKLGLIFCISGAFGAFLGTYITSVISSEVLKNGYGVYAIFMAVNVIYRWIVKDKSPDKKKASATYNFKSVFFGFSGGIVSGTFGTSGTAPVIAGLLSLNTPLKVVIGTSLMIVLSNGLFATTAHVVAGNIDLTLVGFLTAGSLIGALIGPKLLSKVNTTNKESKARYLFAVILLTIGILMLVK
jgi:uncharacterized membrane protein YfcA